VVVVAAAGEVLALPFSLDPELELVPEEVLTGGQDAFGLPVAAALPVPPPAHHMHNTKHNEVRSGRRDRDRGVKGGDGGVLPGDV